jgi:hypothetical protein
VRRRWSQVVGDKVGCDVVDGVDVGGYVGSEDDGEYRLKSGSQPCRRGGRSDRRYRGLSGLRGSCGRFGGRREPSQRRLGGERNRYVGASRQGRNISGTHTISAPTRPYDGRAALITGVQLRSRDSLFPRLSVPRSEKQHFGVFFAPTYPMSDDAYRTKGVKIETLFRETTTLTVSSLRYVPLVQNLENGGILYLATEKDPITNSNHIVSLCETQTK